MSELISRRRCPECAKVGRDKSGDNLAVYDDHVHCYSCHYNESFQKPLRDILQAKVQAPMSGAALPHDASTDIALKAGQWLAQYGITREEVIDAGLMWSESRQMLIFPFRGENETLLGWQGRRFEERALSRYFTQGKVHDLIQLYNTEQALKRARLYGIIIVEDCVSAIKLCRTACAVPVFGSNVSVEQMARYQKLTSHLYFWLDYDKRISSLHFSKNARQLGLTSASIVTELDPKEYEDAEIEDILGNAGYFDDKKLLISA